MRPTWRFLRRLMRPVTLTSSLTRNRVFILYHAAVADPLRFERRYTGSEPDALAVVLWINLPRGWGWRTRTAADPASRAGTLTNYVNPHWNGDGTSARYRAVVWTVRVSRSAFNLQRHPRNGPPRLIRTTLAGFAGRYIDYSVIGGLKWHALCESNTDLRFWRPR